jgi:cell division inhibitor SulA
MAATPDPSLVQTLRTGATHAQLKIYLDDLVREEHKRLERVSDIAELKCAQGRLMVLREFLKLIGE